VRLLDARRGQLFFRIGEHHGRGANYARLRASGDLVFGKWHRKRFLTGTPVTLSLTRELRAGTRQLREVGKNAPLRYPL
jgi:hypothetical protein